MIAPDDKNWTWVVERLCPECGFDASACRADEVAQLVRENVAMWRRLEAEGMIRAGRPDDSTWSTLEYACHVRDVYRRYEQRITLMLTEDDPLFPDWDQDASAVDDRYDEQNPTAVAAELTAAGESLATVLDAVGDDQWDRLGRRSDGSAFTVETISRYMIHDPVHHVWDVTRQTSSLT